MKKEFLFFSVISFIELLFLVQRKEYIIGPIIYFIINLVFYFFIKKFYLQRKNYLNGLLFLQRSILSSYNQTIQKDNLDFAISLLPEKQQKELTICSSNEEKLEYIAKEYQLRPFYLFKEIMLMNLKKSEKMMALKVNYFYLERYLGGDDFYLEEKKIKKSLIYILEVNLILLILKFILSLDYSLSLSIFFLIVFFLEIIILYLQIERLFKNKMDNKEIFICEYLTQINYKTPFVSYEDSLFCLDKKFENDFRKLTDGFTQQSFLEVQQVIDKYNNCLIRDFLLFAFKLSYHNCYGEKDFSESEELLHKIRQNKFYRQDYLILIDYLFCGVVLFLIYYLLNNYGTI